MPACEGFRYKKYTAASPTISTNASKMSIRPMRIEDLLNSTPGGESCLLQVYRILSHNATALALQSYNNTNKTSPA